MIGSADPAKFKERAVKGSRGRVWRIRAQLDVWSASPTFGNDALMMGIFVRHEGASALVTLASC